MAYPVKPTAHYDYVTFQAGNPTTPLPADQVSNDFANGKTATDAIIDFIKIALRSDGQLTNGIVTKDALSTAVLALMGGWLPRGDWATATAYAAKDWVRYGGTTYVCVTAHTSGTFATDLAAGKWAVVGTSGSNAFTTTDAGFTMPAIGSTVSVTVIDTTWMVVGQMLYVGTAGFMSVSSITDSTHVVLTNTGAYGNAAAAASIATAKTVSPAGALGGHWYYGSGAPANTLGADGDFYLRDTGLVYAKAAGSWSSTGINLTGPPGATGATGATGAAGVNGNGAPNGRLTLTSATPILTQDVTGAATLYYTPYIGNQVPLYDGVSAFVPTTFAELSNDLTQSSTNKAGPAAAGPYQCIDAFVWSDAGTVRLTRGPKWTASATATITIATPGVVTWTSHGLWDGATVRFTTTGALPTGLAVNTDYFVTKVDANSFKLSTTLANQVAGTYITTSGSQSGTHTAFNYTSSRGTGAGTTELELVNGVWVNKQDITNGPLARKGTYVGTIYCNGSSQVDFKLGTTAANGGEAFIGLWNAYNRRQTGGFVGETTNSWGSSSAAWRPYNGSATNRISMVRGLNEDVAEVSFAACQSATSAVGWIGVGLNKVNGAEQDTTTNQGASGTVLNAIAHYRGLPGLGLCYLSLNEYGGTGVGIYGDAGAAGGGYQGGGNYVAWH